MINNGQIANPVVMSFLSISLNIVGRPTFTFQRINYKFQLSMSLDSLHFLYLYILVYKTILYYFI